MPKSKSNLGVPANWATRVVARFLLSVAWVFGQPICGVRIVLERTPNSLKASRRIYAANHHSLFDTPIIFKTLPQNLQPSTATVGGLDFFKPRPNHSRFERCWRTLVILFIRGSLNVALIDRVRGEYSELDRLHALIEEGWSLLIFPEATRSRTGDRSRFRLGAAELARCHNLPVIPVNIDGTQRVLPAGVSWPRRGTVNIRHGDPLFAEEGESSGEFTKRIEDAIAALRPEVEGP